MLKSATSAGVFSILHVFGGWSVQGASPSQWFKFRALGLRRDVKHGKHCFGRERHGRLGQMFLFNILVQYVAKRGEQAVNASVLGMEAI